VGDRHRSVGRSVSLWLERRCRATADLAVHVLITDDVDVERIASVTV